MFLLRFVHKAPKGVKSTQVGFEANNRRRNVIQTVTLCEQSFIIEKK